MQTLFLVYAVVYFIILRYLVVLAIASQRTSQMVDTPVCKLALLKRLQHATLMKRWEEQRGWRQNPEVRLYIITDLGADEEKRSRGTERRLEGEEGGWKVAIVGEKNSKIVRWREIWIKEGNRKRGENERQLKWKGDDKLMEKERGERWKGMVRKGEGWMQQCRGT